MQNKIDGHESAVYTGVEQPAPTPNDKPAVWDMVVADMKARDHVGLGRYGTRLQPFNGRDGLRDAYDEILDLAVYLRQEIYERQDTASLQMLKKLGFRSYRLTKPDGSYSTVWSQGPVLTGEVTVVAE